MIISGGANNTQIYGNYVGLNAAGTTALGNTYHGIVIRQQQRHDSGRHDSRTSECDLRQRRRRHFNAQCRQQRRSTATTSAPMPPALPMSTGPHGTQASPGSTSTVDPAGIRSEARSRVLAISSLATITTASRFSEHDVQQQYCFRKLYWHRCYGPECCWQFWWRGFLLGRGNRERYQQQRDLRQPVCGSARRQREHWSYDSGEPDWPGCRWRQRSLAMQTPGSMSSVPHRIR
jgi:hypothetical protein